MYTPVGGRFIRNDKLPLMGQQPKEIEKSSKKAPSFSVSAARQQIVNDFDMIGHMLFGSAIEADRLVDAIKRTKVEMKDCKEIDKPKLEKKIVDLKKELSGRVLTSIFVMPVTVLLVAPIVPLWATLAFINGIVKGASGKSVTQQAKKVEVDDWNVRNYSKP